MKVALTLILLCLMHLAGISQPLSTAYSEPFDEPEEDRTRLFQSRNGNTLQFEFGKDLEFTVTVYNKSRNVVTRKTAVVTALESMDLYGSDVAGIFDCGSDVAVLIASSLGSKEQKMARLLVSPDSGTLLKAEVIVEIPKYERGQGFWTIETQSRRAKSFKFAKDPSSDAYTVVAFDPYAKVTSKRIYIVLYDEHHKEVAKSYFEQTSPTKNKVLDLLAVAMPGKEEVLVCANGYNISPESGKNTMLLLSLKAAGATVHELNFQRNQGIPTVMMQYNPKSSLLEMLVQFRTGSKSPAMSNTTTYYFEMLHAYINAKDYSTVSAKSPDLSQLSSFRATQYGTKGEFNGVPVQLTLNEQGISSIVLTETTGVYAGGGVGGDLLGDIGVLEYSADGTLIRSYVARRNQSTRSNLGYYQHQVFATRVSSYVAYNDHPANFRDGAEKRPALLGAIAEANTVCYRLTGTSWDRMYFFGKPDGDFENRYADFGTGHYDSITGVFAVMIIERKGRRTKHARIAWVHID